MRPFFPAWLLTITRGKSEIGHASDISKTSIWSWLLGRSFQLFDTYASFSTSLPLVCSSSRIPHREKWAGKIMAGRGTPSGQGVWKLNLEASSGGLPALGTLATTARSATLYPGLQTVQSWLLQDGWIRQPLSSHSGPHRHPGKKPPGNFSVFVAKCARQLEPGNFKFMDRMSAVLQKLFAKALLKLRPEALDRQALIIH